MAKYLEELYFIRPIDGDTETVPPDEKIAKMDRLTLVQLKQKLQEEQKCLGGSMMEWTSPRMRETERVLNKVEEALKNK